MIKNNHKQWKIFRQWCPDPNPILDPDPTCPERLDLDPVCPRGWSRIRSISDRIRNSAGADASVSHIGRWRHHSNNKRWLSLKSLIFLIV